MKPAKKVVIVGSKFGEVYLNAFIQPQDKWHLIGLFPKVALVLENYLKHSVFHFLLDLINYLKK